MGFWDKLEKAAKKIEESANEFEKKADAFLEKHFPEEEPEKTTYSSEKLLSLTKSKIRKIAGAKLLEGLKALNSNTTKLCLSKLGEDDGVYDGIDIATATIERIDDGHPKLSEVQYRIVLKGMVSGEDDYGGTSACGKYSIELTIDECAEYVVDKVRVMNRW